jgi:N6-adenosine-specific RNA methylase IME4
MTVLPSRISCKRAEAEGLGAVWVGAATNWSSHFDQGEASSAQRVALYRDWFNSDDRRAAICRDNLHTLRGQTLATDDPLEEPCHADVLIELANVGLEGEIVNPPLMHYDAFCRAIAAAVAVDEIALIRNKAAALQAAARVAKNKVPEVQCAELVLRAERRLGQMLTEQKATVGMAPGGQPYQDGTPTGSDPEQVARRAPTLKEVGIDRKLSMRAQKLAAVPADKFEGMVTEWKGRVAKEGERVTTNLLKEGEQQLERQRRAETKLPGGGKVEDLHALVSQGYRAGVIYADPARRFKTWSERGEDRSAIQHYNMQALEELKALPIPALAAADCGYFSWVLDWDLELAFELIKHYGFSFKTVAFTWVKLTEGHDYTPRFDGKISDRDFHFGMGKWTRANPEMCWLATRGSPPRLDAGVRQLVIHPLMEHSRKPDLHDRIERLAGGPYIEFNARRERENWLTWGDELPFPMPVAGPTEPVLTETQRITAAIARTGLPNPFFEEPFDPPPGVPREQWAAEMRRTSDLSEVINAHAAQSVPPVADDQLEIPPFLRRSPDPEKSDSQQPGSGEQP